MASPTVAATNTSATTSAGTAHTVNLPASIAAGNLLLVFFAYHAPDGAETISATGWTNISGFVTRQGAQSLHALYRQADGGEGATVTVTSSISTKAAHTSYRITGHEDPATQAPEAGTGTSGTGAANAADPPSVTVTGGSKDILAIASMALQTETYTGQAAPTNYTNLLTTNSGTAGTVPTNGMIQTAERQLTASSEDPGVFGHTDATPWCAQTIIIHPAAAGGAFEHLPLFGIRRPQVSLVPFDSVD